MVLFVKGGVHYCPFKNTAVVESFRRRVIAKHRPTAASRRVGQRQPPRLHRGRACNMWRIGLARTIRVTGRAWTMPRTWLARWHRASAAVHMNKITIKPAMNDFILTSPE